MFGIKLRQLQRRVDNLESELRGIRFVLGGNHDELERNPKYGLIASHEKEVKVMDALAEYLGVYFQEINIRKIEVQKKGGPERG